MEERGAHGCRRYDAKKHAAPSTHYSPSETTASAANERSQRREASRKVREPHASRRRSRRGAATPREAAALIRHPRHARRARPAGTGHVAHTPQTHNHHSPRTVALPPRTSERDDDDTQAHEQETQSCESVSARPRHALNSVYSTGAEDVDPRFAISAARRPRSGDDERGKQESQPSCPNYRNTHHCYAYTVSARKLEDRGIREKAECFLNPGTHIRLSRPIPLNPFPRVG